MPVARLSGGVREALPLCWERASDLCPRDLVQALVEREGHVMGRELGFRKAARDSTVGFKGPHGDREDYEAGPRQPTCQPGFPPPTHPLLLSSTCQWLVPELWGEYNGHGSCTHYLCIGVAGGNPIAALFI